MKAKTREAIEQGIEYLKSRGVKPVDGAYAITAKRPIVDGEMMHAPDTPAQHDLCKKIWAEEDAAGLPRSFIGFVVPPR